MVLLDAMDDHARPLGAEVWFHMNPKSELMNIPPLLPAELATAAMYCPVPLAVMDTQALLPDDDGLHPYP